MSETAWIDQRALSKFLIERYGATAGLFSAWVIRDLVSAGIPVERYRRERYRADGKRIGPDLRMSLETAMLVADIFAAAHTAALRVLARRRAGLSSPQDDDRLLEVLEVLEVLDLLLSAGCETPAVG